MPEEVFIVVIVAILSGTLMITGIVRSIFRYLSSRNQPSQTGSSLTTGELERMLRAVVEDATAPLAAQIERLERRLDAPLLAPPDEPLLDEEALETPDAVAPARHRARAR